MDFKAIGAALRRLRGEAPSGRKFAMDGDGTVKPTATMFSPSMSRAVFGTYPSPDTLTPEQRKAEKYRQAGFHYARDGMVGEFVVPLAEMEAHKAKPEWPTPTHSIFKADDFSQYNIEQDVTYLESNPGGESWVKDRFVVENLRQTAADGFINILNPLAPGCGDPHCPACYGPQHRTPPTILPFGGV